MTTKTFNVFRGLNLKADSSIIGDFATVAAGCDLSSGKIKNFSLGYGYQTTQPTSISSAATGFNINYPCFLGDVWRSLTNTLFLSKLSNIDIEVLSVPASDPIKQFYPPAGGTISISTKLGQEVPTGLAVNNSAVPGSLETNREYYYAVTTVREVPISGSPAFRDESGPVFGNKNSGSTFSSMFIPRPTTYDSEATYWRIYRLSSITGKYEFLVENTIATANYTDTGVIADEDLGEEIASYFIADETGDTYSYAPLVDPGDWDFARYPFNGLMFAYNGNVLRWSLPNLFDAWPEQLFINLPETIEEVIPSGERCFIITTSKIYEIFADNPFIIRTDEITGGVTYDKSYEKGEFFTVLISKNGYSVFDRGFLFLNADGINYFNGSSVNVLSHGFWPKQTASTRIISVTALDRFVVFIAKTDGVDYNQTYVYDIQDKNLVELLNLTTFPDADKGYDGFSLTGDDNIVLTTRETDTGILDTIKVLSILQSTDGEALPMVYRSSEKLLSDMKLKNIHSVEFNGSVTSGETLTLRAIIDGVIVSERVVTSLALREDRVLGVASVTKCRSFQFEIEGYGEITEVQVVGE